MFIPNVFTFTWVAKYGCILGYTFELYFLGIKQVKDAVKCYEYLDTFFVNFCAKLDFVMKNFIFQFRCVCLWTFHLMFYMHPNL
jgi:hypothetical protein